MKEIILRMKRSDVVNQGFSSQIRDINPKKAALQLCIHNLSSMGGNITYKASCNDFLMR
jgi:hypothetical protein